MPYCAVLCCTSDGTLQAGKGCVMQPSPFFAGNHTTMQTAMSPLHWLVPQWPAPPQVHALCTTRHGGVSAVPFDSLNLGDHVGDDPEAVAANRRRLQKAISTRKSVARMEFLQQVHGTEVALMDIHNPFASRLCADACVATGPGKVCTIMVADCLPVLLTNRQGSAVAAAHAGWRGLAGADCHSGLVSGGQGVVESVLESFWAAGRMQQAPAAMKNEVLAAPCADGTCPAQASDTLAWLGPCIGPQAFEVGAEVRAAFCEHNAAAAGHFQPAGAGSTGKYLADLAGLARQRLRAAGVTQIYGNDSSAPWCTVGNPSQFFSHRRDSARLGSSGRFAVCIWRD